MKKWKAAEWPQHGKRMFFTGPDGIGDYRPRSNYFPGYIGVGSPSPEATGDLGFLWRAAPQAPPPMPKHSYVGEVGWGLQYNQLLNSGTLLSNMQIKKTDIRMALEDGVTHRFQDTKKSVTEGKHTPSRHHISRRQPERTADGIPPQTAAGDPEC